ncbi:unnamed protein product [Sphenostylis stenocarpa]|uniref:Uncharacterized protein n=1 Tax=Sphenostylis stenocarpa TaxID=92480 RepID=A0AA86VAE2_9FABA|nr:unnamed protein product [Sphenostylis stenocarpa]
MGWQDSKTSSLKVIVCGPESIRWSITAECLFGQGNSNCLWWSRSNTPDSKMPFNIKEAA